MLNEAIAIAKTNPTDLNRMAAIIAKRGRVLGKGMNSRRSHPLQKLFSKSDVKIALHAEISAIVDALRNNGIEELKGASIFVARVLKSGVKAKAKPCEICQRAISAYGITAIYYTEG
jgi:tRNA(Arg) A34 adenosine deaminase TadA